MKAIILAAGVSRRLYPLTEAVPKCLLRVGEKPIIAYQLEALQALNVLNATVVVGYYREQLQDYLNTAFPQFGFNYVVNHHFFDTNTAYSMYLCREELGSDQQLIMNGDVLYPKALLQRIMEAKPDSVLAVDVKPCGSEEVKVIEGDHQRIVAIGKRLMPENVLGEFLGVARFSQPLAQAFAQSLATLVEAGGKEDYFEAAIDPLLKTFAVNYVDVSDLPCIEIDFVEDYENAQKLVQNPLFSGAPFPN